MSGRRRYPVAPVPAVGAVVFHGGQVLLVCRRNPPSRNLWAIPGGRILLGESLKEAAEREILEETGVRVRAGEPVFAFDAIVRDDEGGIRYHYVIVDLVAEYLEGTPEARDDALDARWVAPEELEHLAVSPPTLELLRARLGFGGRAPSPTPGGGFSARSGKGGN